MAGAALAFVESFALRYISILSHDGNRKKEEKEDDQDDRDNNDET